MDKIDLSKYTKAELIEILNRVLRDVDPFGRIGYLRGAIADFEFKRQMRKIEEAHKYARKAGESRYKYIELAEPFKGRKLMEIPIETLEKMQKCIEEAARYEKKYERLYKEIDAYGQGN